MAIDAEIRRRPVPNEFVRRVDRLRLTPLPGEPAEGQPGANDGYQGGER